MKAYRQRYLRARAEISSDEDGDILGQKRRYLPAKPHKGLTDKMHIVVMIPPRICKIGMKVGNIFHSQAFIRYSNLINEEK